MLPGVNEAVMYVFLCMSIQRYTGLSSPPPPPPRVKSGKSMYATVSWKEVNHAHAWNSNLAIDKALEAIVWSKSLIILLSVHVC